MSLFVLTAVADATPANGARNPARATLVASKPLHGLAIKPLAPRVVIPAQAGIYILLRKCVAFMLCCAQAQAGAHILLLLTAPRKRESYEYKIRRFSVLMAYFIFTAITH